MKAVPVSCKHPLSQETAPHSFTNELKRTECWRGEGRGGLSWEETPAIAAFDTVPPMKTLAVRCGNITCYTGVRVTPSTV